MVQFATYTLPFGLIEIGHEDGKIISIRRTNSFSAHDSSAVSELAYIQLQEYFDGRRKCFDLPINPKGTSFQVAVWRCILEIPFGELRTYGQIAASLGKPGAGRAVGQAAKQNPLWIVIPCHRVVGSNCALTGYAGGLDMKQALLNLEQAI